MAERVSAAAPGRPRRRRVAGIALAATAALLAYAALVEPRWVVVTRHGIGRPRAGARPLRVVQLSDLHLHGIGARERRIAALARAERPELLVLTGDQVESAEALPALDELLSMIGGEAPVLAILGNWEHWGKVPSAALAAVLARHRGRLLVNEAALGVHEGGRWAVLGLDWPDGRVPDGDPALAPGVDRLVLLHAPAGRDAWTGPPAAAMLSGHTHGGQVAFGRFAPAIPPGSARYVSGWYRGPPIDLYVSRGLGTSILPLRLGARPEIAVFEWWVE